MFKPQLEHNRTEFNELNRKKWRAFVLILFLVVPLGALGMVFPDSAWRLTVIFLLAASAVIISYEVKMTLVFKRDLREQRELSER
jgi:fatty acid desaturase